MTQEIDKDAVALMERIDAAIQRIVNGQGCMRIPADPTDPDLVLADCKRALASRASSGAAAEQITDAELTAIYKRANGEDTGKAKPLTTANIFRAMRAALSLQQAARQEGRTDSCHLAASNDREVIQAGSLSSGREHVEGACGVHSGEGGVSAPSAGGSAQ